MIKRFTLICCLMSVLLLGCGINKKALEEELQEYPSLVPQWVIDTYSKPRFIRVSTELPDAVKKAAKAGVDVVNRDLKAEVGISNRFRMHSSTTPADALVIDVVIWDGKGICAEPANPALAEIDQSEDGFVVHLCYRKILAARYDRSTNYQGFIDFTCILAHEFFHTDLWVHPQWACDLMCAEPRVCSLSDHEVNIWKKLVLPHIKGN